MANIQSVIYLFTEWPQGLLRCSVRKLLGRIGRGRTIKHKDPSSHIVCPRSTLMLNDRQSLTDVWAGKIEHFSHLTVSSGVSEVNCHVKSG